MVELKVKQMLNDIGDERGGGDGRVELEQMLKKNPKIKYLCCIIFF